MQQAQEELEMDKKRIIEDIMQMEREHRKTWMEKEYNKIEEIIEKQRARERLLNNSGMIKYSSF